MSLPIKLIDNHLKIYHEGRKRRVFVGELFYDKKKDKYDLIYDKKYAHSKNAIPISPTLSLFKLRHQSEKGKIFPVFLDRIPEKSNPAYRDYCKAMGISPDEKNPIILLGTIGRRGPSSFIFESVYQNEFDPASIATLRKQLSITQHDLALAFSIKKSTLQRLESGASQDFNTLKLLQIMFEFPEVALWQLRQTSGQINTETYHKLIQFFEKKVRAK